jgi:rhodanese-related sulfurtransferase
MTTLPRTHALRRASLAAKSLEDLGFTDVTAVVMTLDEWQKGNNPLVK